MVAGEVTDQTPEATDVIEQLMVDSTFRAVSRSLEGGLGPCGVPRAEAGEG